ARETVAREQRPVDPLLAILPAAPARDGGKKRVVVLSLDLFADDLFVTRSGPDCIPAAVVHVECQLPAAGSAARPASYAFLISSFFHSIRAVPRSFFK